MKKIVIFSLVALLVFSGCAERKTINKCQDGKQVSIVYEPYGVFNMGEKDPDISYKLSVGNAVITFLTLETIIIPVIIIGWYLYEPVGLKVVEKEKGIQCY
jgi:hypothetical protein